MVIMAGTAHAQQAPAPDLVPLPFPEIDTPILPEPGTLWWVVAVGVAVLTVLLAALILLLVRSRNASPPGPPPHALKRAISSLESLLQRCHELPPAEAGYQVSQILRIYQLERYRVPAPALTTEELYEGGALDARYEVRERFAPLARFYDRLAFAREPATPTEAAQLITEALNVLQGERVHQARAEATGVPDDESQEPLEPAQTKSESVEKPSR